MQACTSHVNASVHQAVTARKLPSFQVHYERKTLQQLTDTTLYFPLPSNTVAAYISKGVTTLPHNYHAGQLRHNATKLRACNLDTPQISQGQQPLTQGSCPPKNSGSVELNHAAPTYLLTVGPEIALNAINILK